MAWGKAASFRLYWYWRQSFETGELRNGRLVLGGQRTDIGTGQDVLYEDADRDEVGFGTGK